MVRLYFYPLGESYLLVAVLALLLVGLLAIGPGRASTSRRQRIVLTSLRAAIMLLAILAILRPTLVYTKTTRQPATLVLLVDHSRSMTVPDETNQRRRWDAVRKTLSDSQAALARLARHYEIRAYRFDADASPVAVDHGRIALDSEPAGDQTAIGKALQTVLGREAGKRLLGVVLLSDGAQRALPPNDLLPQTAAAQMKARGDAIYSLRFGKSRGPGQAQDLALEDVQAAEEVFVNNELTVTGKVRADGYVNRRVPVRLLYETSPQRMEVVAVEEVTAVADAQLLPFTFRYQPTVAGEHKLSVEIPEQAGELAITNNRTSTFVNVLKGGLRVLYLEGFPPRIEQNFLRRALDASPDIHVDTFGIDPARPETRPADLAERLAPGRYEVLILGDLDSTAFRPPELEAMARSVSRGEGLIMLGGIHTFGAGGYAETPLADVLPVVTHRLERQRPGDPVRKDLHLPGEIKVRPTQQGLRHFTLTLAADPARNRAVWESLPPLVGANRFGKLKPLARVLAEGPAGEPLLVAQPYGGGRVMAFAGDTTWRWQMHGQGDAYKRFWRQIVLWLARKDESQQGNVWVHLPRRRYAPRERVELVVGVQAPSGESVAHATGQAEIELPDGNRRPLPLAAGSEGLTGSFQETDLPGDYTIRVTVRQGEKTLGTAQARFLVRRQDLELDNASADASLLESLAGMTGGKTLAPEELPGLLDELDHRTEGLIETTQIKRSLWDRWPFFLLLVAMLTLEWYLRKRWRLV